MLLLFHQGQSLNLRRLIEKCGVAMQLRLLKEEVAFVLAFLLIVTATSPVLTSNDRETKEQADITPPTIYVELNGLNHFWLYIGQAVDLYLWAHIFDASNVSGANYTIGRGNWSSSSSLDAADGAFDQTYEVATAHTFPPLPVVGTYEYCVYAWDEHGNWNQGGSCAILDLTNDVFDKDETAPEPAPLVSLYAAPDRNVVCYEDSISSDVWLYRLASSNQYLGFYPWSVEWSLYNEPMACYRHWGAGTSNPDDFYYRLYVADHHMNWARSDVVAKIYNRLEEGPRLLSLPVINENPVHLIQIWSSFNEIRYYDTANPNNPWVSYSKVKPYQDFGELEIGRGYWINMTQNDTLTAMGVIPSSVGYDLVVGWNLVGYCSPYSRSVASALSGIANYKVEGYSDKEPYHLQHLTGSSIMEPFEAYWIWVPTDTTWILGN